MPGEVRGKSGKGKNTRLGKPFGTKKKMVHIKKKKRKKKKKQVLKHYFPVHHSRSLECSMILSRIKEKSGLYGQINLGNIDFK